MNLTGPAYLTTRTHDNIFKQLKVQWFLKDRVDTIPDNIELKLGCTTIYNDAADNMGVDSYLHIYGKDMQGNLYYKKVIMRREEDTEEYNVSTTSGASPFRVVEGIFFVRKVAMGNVNYYILEDKGIYMLLDVSEFNAYGNTTYQSSVYEFNTMFPASTTTLTKIYAKDTLLDVHNLEFNSNKDSDVLWDADGSSIIASMPQPKIKELAQRQYIESINGISMTSGVVNVSYSLGQEVNVETVPGSSSGVFYPAISIPDDASTNNVYIPLKIEGIKANEEVYTDYGFNQDTFGYTWELSGNPLSWYKSCKEAWVKLSTSKDDPKDVFGIAGLTLGVDGNVPTVPALSANVVGFTPEYRLFNPQFTTKTVNKISQDAVMSGSFTIVKKYGKRTYTVKDASDDDDNMAIIIDDDGQYPILVPQYKSHDKGTLVAKALYNETNPAKSTVTIRVESEIDYAPKRGIDSATNRRFIEKIIGRVIKKGTKTKVYQEHTGIMYFDFREGGDKYEGQFKISKGDTPGSISVSGGRVRIINQSVNVQGISITLTVKSSIFIHATMTNGTAAAVIETAYYMPSESATNSYYLIGTVDTNGKIVQDHHGGTPLFLFFSSDCIDEEEDSETTE